MRQSIKPSNMEHIAIMKKSWGLTDKILSGQKKIESRWYLNKTKPWDSIKQGDTIYFKDSGEPVRVKAKVSKVLQFADLTPSRVKELLNKYGKDDGLNQAEIPEFFKLFKNKRYGMLIFLKNPAKVKPFDINKRGFGLMSAWITVNRISRIKN
ncbi:MAG: hypothetical protein ABH805_00020 [Candidatus Nealsonbacteria bacterium]